MAITTVAFRYAKSLFDLAQEQNLTETLYSDMQLVGQTIGASRPLALMLKSPIVRNDKKASVLHAVFGAWVNPVTMNFMDIVARKGRDGMLDAIANEFVRLYDQQRGIERATVITTTPLTDDLRQRFKAIVANTTGSQLVELEEQTDAKLIGGYVLKLGDRQIDASVRSQLNDLRVSFLN
jgi:F-type H+-transporting ATPase subunit delta